MYKWDSKHNEAVESVESKFSCCSHKNIQEAFSLYSKHVPMPQYLKELHTIRTSGYLKTI